MTARTKVLHPITRMIVGGAQENTMLTVHLLDKTQWDAAIITGPQAGPEGSLLDAAAALDVPVTVEPSFVREINPVQDIRALVRLRRIIRDGGYVIVHTHSSKTGIIGRWAARWAGAPVIIHTVHGWGHHDRQHLLVRKLYIWLEKRALPFTDKLIAVSPSNVEKGLADGIGTPDDYVVIRSGIELDRFGHPLVPREETRRAWGIPLDAPVVGSVTRLSPQKAPLDFVAAAAQIHAQRPDVWFLLVGDGPLRADAEARARELGISDRLVMTGLRRDVPELMAAFDIFALSSLWEGLPRVLPQAMATGLPIVTTAADGNAEAVEDGVTGLVVPAGEPPALAAALLRLLDDPALAQQMGDTGRARVDEFSATRMVDQIAALYTEILARKQLPAPP